MKKVLVLILSLLVAIFCVGCGYTIKAEDSSNTDTPPVTTPGDDGDAVIYTVSLVYNDQSFRPTETIYARWIGDEGVYEAEFDVFGVAKHTGLDGDYRVTLSSAPSGFTYDPNNIYTDNDHRDIKINLLKLITPNPFVGIPPKPNGDGSDIYEGAIQISQLGTYRTIIDKRFSGSRSDVNNANGRVFFSYKPLASGVYSIESWVDIVTNQVNPIVDRFNGTFAFSKYADTQNDGGSFSTFTKNFRMLISLTEQEVSNVWKFAICADVVDELLYPATIDFTIKYESGYTVDNTVYETVTANGPFATSSYWEENPYETGTFRYLYEDTDKVMTPNHPSGQVVTLNPADGFYHLYNEETDTWGKVIYANISCDNEMIQGEGEGFMIAGASLIIEGKSYRAFMNTYGKYCIIDASKRVGIHPVNQELKEFLQAFAINERVFADGYGTAEYAGYVSGEDNMWLLVCGYSA